ncbi:MAG: 1-deoxy-D-xylulose-5-phosphate reductoisomerase [Dehalococcoidales bacterium]
MGDSVKRLAVLGSTGSIGRQTLQVVRRLSSRFRVVALTAGRNAVLLAEQIGEFRPEFVHCTAEDAGRFPAGGPKVLSPEEIAGHDDVDCVVIAVSGSAALAATLAAVRAGKEVALANKESLVMAGDVITGEAKRSGARILPIDSEHSAVWQCLTGEPQPPARLILTASGGPFRGYSPEQLAAVTAAEALAHPSWRMGPKVTIDSATLMNKGLEVIEARWLFDMPFDRIDVVIHPQSIIHSMVEFADGSVKAQLSSPDMRLPIQYALTYPERVANPDLPRLDFAAAGKPAAALTFESPDLAVFPCLEMAVAAGRDGGTRPAVLCGADEAAVGLFLDGKIGFDDIPRLVQTVLDEHRTAAEPSLAEIMAAETWARGRVTSLASEAQRC